jgi:hypothetical protein
MHLKKLIYLILNKESIFTTGGRGGRRGSGGGKRMGKVSNCMCIFRTANYPMPVRE